MDPSPQPREWHRVSERWHQQLVKLANTNEANVVKVGNVVFGTDDEFHIARGSGLTEVFLGLRDDGTEVAVKRMTRHNYKVLKNEEGFLRLPELDDPSIVRYVDFVEDDNWGYLVLQLCEYTLEEYIKSIPTGCPSEQIAKQVLMSLNTLHCQNPPILHRNITPRNVLIDVTGKARLSGFGTSRQLLRGQTTHFTGWAGTKCWMAKETLNEGGDDVFIPYKRSTDIQVAGMLLYYILSGGYHPFGSSIRCEANILDGKYSLHHVQDVLAKDLIKRMINEDPKKRPTVEECLAHPYFWGKKRRKDYLIRLGNEQEVQNVQNADQNLIRSLEQYAEKGIFNAWKDKFPAQLIQKMETEIWMSYPENGFGLLRFIHHLHVYYPDDAAPFDLMKICPGLFESVYMFAQDQGWNTRTTLKELLIPQPPKKRTLRKWFPVSKRWREQLEELANTVEGNVVKVGNVVFGTDGKYRIAKGNDGSEVFLGLKDDDGTEVAVKRLAKSNYEVLKNQKGLLSLPKFDDPSIVRYVDLEDDEYHVFSYVNLQFCEYTLAEYIEDYIRKGNEFPGRCVTEQEIIKHILVSLKTLHCQNPPILHRDIKPQNVLIDIWGRARLADFGKSSSAGTKCWKAKETMDENGDTIRVEYERSADIQVVGMLIYYILSGGHHPFGESHRGIINIFDGNCNLDHVQDEVAKNLIEKMINKDPKKRPTVEECLAHPYFWSNERREDYLINVGNEQEVVNYCQNADQNLSSSQYDKKGLFNAWRDKFPPQLVQKMETEMSYPENVHGLLHFMHNLCEHHPQDADDFDLMKMFPGLFESVLQGRDVQTEPPPPPRKWVPSSERWKQKFKKLTKAGYDNVVKFESLVVGKGDEFRIATGCEGTEVFLGLRNDGIELAVKRVKKTSKGLKYEKELFQRTLIQCDGPHIVKYRGFDEDKNFGYLSLQLCEYTLKEYIEDYIQKGIEFPRGRLPEWKIANQVLMGLKMLHCQNTPVLHRDIKPQNVLIDLHGNARVSDFGLSRHLPEDESKVLTCSHGSSCWMATETLKMIYPGESTLRTSEVDVAVEPVKTTERVQFRTSSDIQVAGMLIYYILSGGHHPFGERLRCEANIVDGIYNLKHVQDVLAKDLIERMINKDPKKRPTVEECLAHPFFWSKERRVKYLKDIGNVEEIAKCGKADEVLIKDLHQYDEKGIFNAWKAKFPTEVFTAMTRIVLGKRDR